MKSKPKPTAMASACTASASPSPQVGRLRAEIQRRYARRCRSTSRRQCFAPWLPWIALSFQARGYLFCLNLHCRVRGIPPDPSTASRMLGASVSRGLDGGVGTATEHDAGDAAAGRPPRDGRVPGEQAERAAILRQHVGAELMDAALLSRTKDFLEEERAEAESLPAVRNDEADVGSGDRKSTRLNSSH